MIGNLGFNISLVVSGFNALCSCGKQSFAQSMVIRIVNGGYDRAQSKELLSRLRFSCTVTVLGLALAGYFLSGMAVAVLAATIATAIFHLCVSWPIEKAVHESCDVLNAVQSIENASRQVLLHIVDHSREDTVAELTNFCKDKELAQKVVALNLERCKFDSLPTEFFEVFSNCL